MELWVILTSRLGDEFDDEMNYNVDHLIVLSMLLETYYIYCYKIKYESRACHSLTNAMLLYKRTNA